MQVCTPVAPSHWPPTNPNLAALCAETKDRQEEILRILRMVLNVSKFPSISILDDLVNVWGGGTKP